MNKFDRLSRVIRLNLSALNPSTSPPRRFFIGFVLLSLLPTANIANSADDAMNICDIPYLSVTNEHLFANDIRYTELTHALEISAISTAQSAPGDLLLNHTSEKNLPDIHIVVKKPASGSKTYQIGIIPADPVDAYNYLLKIFKTASIKQYSTIRFPANTKISLKNPKTGGAHMQIRDLSDVVIDFNGSTLTFMDVAPGIVVKNSQRIALKNGILRSEQLIASIARVEPDADSANGYRFALLPEYASAMKNWDTNQLAALKLHTVGQAMKTDGGWKIKAEGYTDIFANRGNKKLDYYDFYFNLRANSTEAWFSATSPSSQSPFPYKENEYVYLLHENNEGTAIILKNSDGDVEDITIEKIELHNIPGMGIFGEVNRGLHVNQVIISPDSTNALSFWGTSSDAFHINNNGGDIVLENSTLSGSADDLVTVKGNWWEILEIDRATSSVIVGNADRNYGVHRWANTGNRIIAIDGQLNITANTINTRSSEILKNKRHRIFLAEVPDSLNVGALAANPDLAGGRVMIRNNKFSNSRAQGALVQTSHVVIQENTFKNIAGPAIKVNFALQDWYEGVSVSNILIKNNSFEFTGAGAQKPPYDIYISQIDNEKRPVKIINNILFENNNYFNGLGINSCK